MYPIPIPYLLDWTSSNSVKIEWDRFGKSLQIDIEIQFELPRAIFKFHFRPIVIIKNQ